jgi:hypothetical protein
MLRNHQSQQTQRLTAVWLQCVPGGAPIPTFLLGSSAFIALFGNEGDT